MFSIHRRASGQGSVLIVGLGHQPMQAAGSQQSGSLTVLVGCFVSGPSGRCSVLILGLLANVQYWF